MVKGLYTAWTGMLDEQNRLDILTNNLANADTTGYKKEGTTNHTFADTLAIKIKDTSDYGQPRVLGNISMGVLNAIDGVTADVSLEDKCAYITLDKDVADEVLSKAVTDAGYKVKGIK